MAIDNFSDTLQSQLGALQDSAHQTEALFGDLDDSVKAHLGSIAEALNAPVDGLKGLQAQMNTFTNTVQKDFSTSLQNAIKNGTSFADVFSKIGDALENLVIQLGIVDPAMNALFGGNRSTLSDIGNLSSANFQGNTGLLGSLFGGIFSLFEGRALGGPVSSGTPYLVGEQGPELFVPQVAGRISNANTAPLSITMNITTPDANSFRASQAQIAAAVLDSVRQAQRIR